MGPHGSTAAAPSKAAVSLEIGSGVTLRGTGARNRDGTEFFTDRAEPLYELSNNRDFSILGLKQDWVHRLSDHSVNGEFRAVMCWKRDIAPPT